MSTVIGFFPQASGLPQAIQQIQEAGFGKEDCQILRNENAIRKIMSYEPTCVLTKHARWGAITSIMLFCIPTLMVDLCAYNLFGYYYPPGIETFIASILVGAGVGAILGLTVCTVEHNKIMEFFIQGVQKGGKVFLVQAKGEDCERVQIILQQAGSTSIQTLSEPDDKDK